MLGPIVCTNETTLIPRAQPRDATSSSDGNKDDDLVHVGDNPNLEPNTKAKGKRQVLHDSPKPKKKKDIKDEYMKRIVQAIESRTFSSNKTVTSFDNDLVRKEVVA
jgi:hypothetical protein